jgi:hypothetical protein
MKSVRRLRSRYISGPHRRIEHFCLTLLASERLANGHKVFCANHVTWTGQHPMIQGEKALIFIALRWGKIGQFGTGKAR